MTYRENVDELALRANVTNNPKLREEDLWVKGMKYWGENGMLLAQVGGTEMNLAYRLFLQEAVKKTPSVGTIICDERFLADFRKFYADLLDGTQTPDKQPALYWTQNCYRITLEDQ